MPRLGSKKLVPPMSASRRSLIVAIMTCWVVLIGWKMWNSTKRNMSEKRHGGKSAHKTTSDALEARPRSNGVWSEDALEKMFTHVSANTIRPHMPIEQFHDSVKHQVCRFATTRASTGDGGRTAWYDFGDIVVRVHFDMDGRVSGFAPSRWPPDSPVIIVNNLVLPAKGHARRKKNALPEQIHIDWSQRRKRNR